jgi:exopolysaccharide biosynthesis polyprenyl glycosylphosphotransferase
MRAEPIQYPAAIRSIPRSRVPTWVMPAVKTAVFVADGMLAAACFIAAFKLRDGNAVLSSTAWAWSKSFVPYSGVLLFVVPVRLIMLLYERVYRYYGAFSYTQEAAKVFKAVLVGSLLTVAWAFLFRGGFSFRDYSYSRGIFLLDFAFALTAFTLFHLGLRFIQSKIREREINLIPTVVIGKYEEVRGRISELRERKYLGYRVLGVLRSNGDQTADEQIVLDDGSELPVLGNASDLSDIIRDLQIQEVIITDDSLDSDLLFEAMLTAGRSHKVEFRFAPTVFNLLPQKTSVEQIGVLPMVRLFTEPLSDAQRFLKRASDLIIAAVALFATSPLWLLIAVLIKRDSPGRIFFRQERVGMDGRVFLCLKFRTMRADSDESLHRESYKQNIAGTVNAQSASKDAPVFGKVPNDPRITRVGRWLRRSSLDELPQLINVLRGDMSIVGPRPPIPYEVHEYDIWHRRRLDMKPGITGLWQISGRNRLTFEEMVNVDLFYIENWSIWLDVKIILLTLPAVWRADGAT